jgi:tetratricopeptide repeat protein 21B
MTALAKLYQTIGENDQCSAFCAKLLKIDPSNEEATFMQANLMLMNNRTEEAISIYKNLLHKTPNNFNTLSQLIELLKRAGRITDIKPFIEASDVACQRAQLGGLNFCKGLYNWYAGEPQQALKDLNMARFDNVFGSLARISMIMIYLNPSNEMIFSSQKETSYSTTPENINMAKELIQDLHKTDMDTSLLDAQAMISTKDKT